MSRRKPEFFNTSFNPLSGPHRAGRVVAERSAVARRLYVLALAIIITIIWSTQ